MRNNTVDQKTDVRKDVKKPLLQTTLCALLVATCATVYAAPIVKIRDIGGKTMKQVAQVLKSSSPCARVKYGLKCAYDSDRIEIVFIDGRSDWITVRDLEKIPFNENALQAIGLAVTAPSFHGPTVMRWRDIPGLNEVSVFKGQVGSDYAYVKVRTP